LALQKLVRPLNWQSIGCLADCRFCQSGKTAIALSFIKNAPDDEGEIESGERVHEDGMSSSTFINEHYDIGISQPCVHRWLQQLTMSRVRDCIDSL
jgi:hypothetical protein